MIQHTLYEKMDDNDLWTSLVQGDKSVLEFLYKRNYSLLLNYGLKYSFDRELVKDCIHDVFIKIHKNRNLPSINFPRSYLIKALKYTLYDKLSAQKETQELSEYTFSIPDSADLFEQIFSQTDEQACLGKQLLEALSHLSDNQKNALYLRYVKDFSYNEIAEILDINVQSSMNLVSRTIKKLRKTLNASITVAEIALVVNLFCQ